MFGLSQLRSFASMVFSLEPLHVELVRHRTKAIKLVDAQSRRAQKMRILLDCIPLRERIGALVKKPEMREQTAKALWPHLVCMICEFGSNITEGWSGNKCSDWFIDFEYDRHDSLPEGRQDPHKMTYKRFRTIVAEIRKEPVIRAND